MAVFLMLFVCLFDLNCLGSRKNYNLWKSLGDIVVNGAPREVPWVPNGLPQEYIEGSPSGFSSGKASAASSGFWPWVWPWMRPQVCLQKTPRGAFNILPRESMEYSRQPPFTMIPPRFFHRLSQCLEIEIFDMNYIRSLCLAFNFEPICFLHSLGRARALLSDYASLFSTNTKKQIRRKNSKCTNLHMFYCLLSGREIWK